MGKPNQVKSCDRKYSAPEQDRESSYQTLPSPSCQLVYLRICELSI